MPGRPTQESRGPYHCPLKRPPVGKCFADALPQAMERLGFAKRHGETGIHQAEADRQRHLLEARLDGREVVAGRQGPRLKLAQCLGLGVDGHDAPAATQHLDHVAAVAAAEIDGERIRPRAAPKRSSAVINVRRGGRSRSFS